MPFMAAAVVNARRAFLKVIVALKQHGLLLGPSDQVRSGLLVFCVQVRAGQELLPLRLLIETTVVRWLVVLTLHDFQSLQLVLVAAALLDRGATLAVRELLGVEAAPEA